MLFCFWEEILELKPVTIGGSTGYIDAHAPSEWNAIGGITKGIEFLAITTTLLSAE